MWDSRREIEERLLELSLKVLSFQRLLERGIDVRERQEEVPSSYPLTRRTMRMENRNPLLWAFLSSSFRPLHLIPILILSLILALRRKEGKEREKKREKEKCLRRHSLEPLETLEPSESLVSFPQTSKRREKRWQERKK